MRGWVKWVLFGSSYTPFFLILLLRDISWKEGLPRFGLPFFDGFLIAVILLSNGILLLHMWKSSGIKSNLNRQVEQVTSRTGESLNYIATYIIPFLNFETTKDLLPLLILMIVIGILYVSSDLFYTNPMLAMFGYRIYEVALKEAEDPILLISRWRPRAGRVIHAALLVPGGEVYLDVNKEVKNERFPT